MSVRATRNPLLKWRLPEAYQLRYAARRFLGWAYQEPPRKTRNEQSPVNQARPSVGAPA